MTPKAIELKRDINKIEIEKLILQDQIEMQIVNNYDRQKMLLMQSEWYELHMLQKAYKMKLVVLEMVVLE